MLFTIAVFLICLGSAFAQHIDSGSIPGRTGIPEAGVPIDVLVDGRLSLASDDISGPSPVTSPSVQITGNKETSTVSVTTLQAPQDTIRCYERAKEAFTRTHLDIAERELRKATTVYPQFAVAWTLLGRVHKKQARFDLG